MATSNERLRQGIVGHQIGLIRVSSALRQRTLAHLKRTEASLRRQIADRAMTLASDDQTPVTLTPAVQRRLQRLEKAVRDARNPAFKAILGEMRSELTAIAINEPKFMTALIRQVEPVDLPLKQPDAGELKKIVTSRPFQGKLLREWARDIEADERRRIMNEIRIGLTQGRTSREITSRIVGTGALRGTDGVTNLTRGNLQTLVRTAIAHIGNAARREFAEANKRLFKVEQWVAVLDSRTSQICLSLNGRMFPIGKGIFPPAHFNCRSIRAPYLDPTEAVRHRIPADRQRALLRQFGQDEGIGRINSRRQLNRTQRKAYDAFLWRWVKEQIGAVPKVMTTADFLAGLGLDELESVLGVTKARLFTRGGLSLGQLVDREGRPLSLRALAIKEEQAFKRAGVDAEQFDG